MTDIGLVDRWVIVDDNTPEEFHQQMRDAVAWVTPPVECVWKTESEKGHARSLNVLAMGETTARLLGEPTRKLLWLVYLLASVLTATAVSIAGNIGFVGLIVPHLMRLLVGSDHRILLPAAAMFGGLFLVLSDTLARTVLAPRQLPVGVVTALLGVPLFLLLLNRARVKQ